MLLTMWQSLILVKIDERVMKQLAKAIQRNYTCMSIILTPGFYNILKTAYNSI